jgi:hypothetical protein
MRLGPCGFCIHRTRGTHGEHQPGRYIWRFVVCDAIRPWLHRSVITAPDPNFAARAAVALDLYAGTFEGRARGCWATSRLRMGTD